MHYCSICLTGSSMYLSVYYLIKNIRWRIYIISKYVATLAAFDIIVISLFMLAFSLPSGTAYSYETYSILFDSGIKYL